MVSMNVHVLYAAELVFLELEEAVCLPVEAGVNMLSAQQLAVKLWVKPIYTRVPRPSDRLCI